MLILTLLGCTPCEGEPQIVDQTDTWTDDQVGSLREALDGWLDAVGDGRVCIDRVVVDDTADGEAFTAGSVVGVDASDSNPDGQLYTGLCSILDEAEGLEDQAIAADPDNGERLFSTWCSWGPPDYGWVDDVDAACGQTELGDLQHFFLDVVYPNTPAARVDGDLSATMLAPVTVLGLEAGDRYTYNWVQDGDALAFTLQGEEPWEIVRIDPLTGATTVLSERLNVDAGSTVLHGGPGGVVLTTADREADTLRIEVIDTGASYLLTDPDEVAVASAARGTVSEGWLYLAWAWFDTRALVAVDLETGEVRRIDLPDTGISEQVLANAIDGVPGGFVVEVDAADVQSAGDVTSIMTYGMIHYRYDVATDTFTELSQDLEHLSSAGVAGDRLLAGTLWGDAGSVLGAYDVDNDRLLVSDDVCVSDVDRPFAATPDHLWLGDWEGDDLVLTGIAVAE